MFDPAEAKVKFMVPVLGIPLYKYNVEMAAELILKAIHEGEPPRNLCISATGAHGLVEAHRNNDFRKVLTDFYLNLPDGTPGVWVGRIKGAKDMRRCYGPDFFRTVVERSSGTGIKHFLCGGKEGVAEQLKTVCADQFQNGLVVGTFCPPFREISDAEMEKLAQEIDSSGADIVWIGLSTPKQEIFARRLAGYTHVHFLITVGAAFDFHTGKVKQAPKWMQSTGLEWFFRLIIEPRRLYKRYFVVVPMFIYLNIKEFLHFYINKKTDK